MKKKELRTIARQQMCWTSSKYRLHVHVDSDKWMHTTCIQQILEWNSTYQLIHVKPLSSKQNLKLKRKPPIKLTSQIYPI